MSAVSIVEKALECVSRVKVSLVALEFEICITVNAINGLYRATTQCAAFQLSLTVHGEVLFNSDKLCCVQTESVVAALSSAYAFYFQFSHICLEFLNQPDQEQLIIVSSKFSNIELHCVVFKYCI